MFFENLSHGKTVFRQSVSELKLGCFGIFQSCDVVVINDLLVWGVLGPFDAIIMIDKVDFFCFWCRFRFVLNRVFLIRLDEIDDGFASLGSLFISSARHIWGDDSTDQTSQPNLHT
jgi:hypothetical protein